MFFAFLAIFLQINFAGNEKLKSQSDRESVSPPSLSDEELKRKIGQMIMIGFRGIEVDKDSEIVKIIRDLNIGGVVLYDYDVPSHSFPRNIVDFKQTKRLISDLQKYATVPLFIAVDAEGGKINRLKPKYGFLEILSPKELGKIDKEEITRKEAEKLAKELAELGFNMNFAPVVDLEINSQNPIIAKFERSFSSNPQKVIQHARIFIETFKDYNIIPVIKHFPGHGSSTQDSHLGMVDVTQTWRKEELLPYKVFAQEKIIDAIMTAHIFNRKIDEKYPTTLSEKFLNDLLRKKIGFDGIIISDDLQMDAIAKHFGLEEAIIQAINAGVDILLLSNNSPSGYDKDLAYKVHQIIFNATKEGKIPINRILKSSSRVQSLKQKYNIISQYLLLSL